MSQNNLEDGFTEEQIADGERRAAYADLCNADNYDGAAVVRGDLLSDPTFPDTWQEGYEALYPRLRAILKRKFWRLRPQSAIDNTDEALALIMERYRSNYRAGKDVRLMKQSMLANHAFWAVISGRSATRCNGQRGKGRQDVYDVAVKSEESRPHRSRECSMSFRLDFLEWMKQLTQRQREICLCLAIGNSTSEAAHECQCSSAAISLMRRQLERRWREWLS